MSEVPDLADRFCCPTCRAPQVLSTRCRRCKCDLELVAAVRTQTLKLHQACLRFWQTRNDERALDAALARYRLSPDSTSRRLLAVAYCRLGRYQAAMTVGDSSVDGG